MSERYQEAAAELRDLLYDIRRASQDVGYGFFPGGDPNEFTPDPECSTEEERARHKSACEEYDKTGQHSHPAPHCKAMNGGVEPPGFGLGSYVMRDEQAADWAERLERCINRIEEE